MSFGHHLGWSLLLVLMIGDCCIAKAMAQPLVRLEEDELSFWQVTDIHFDLNVVSFVFSSRQIPVFPCVGNNDVLPHDSVAQGPNAVLERLYQSWAPLLPSKRAREDFLAGGYYFADVGASSVRVVALNTIYFFAQNQFASNCTDPASPGAVHLRWLKEVISQTTTDHRHVYFIGHVPPSNWIPSCSVLFFRLVESALPPPVIIQGR